MLLLRSMFKRWQALQKMWALGADASITAFKPSASSMYARAYLGQLKSEFPVSGHVSRFAVFLLGNKITSIVVWNVLLWRNVVSLKSPTKHHPSSVIVVIYLLLPGAGGRWLCSGSDPTTWECVYSHDILWQSTVGVQKWQVTVQLYTLRKRDFRWLSLVWQMTICSLE